jgi:hypothetical protein
MPTPHRSHGMQLRRAAALAPLMLVVAFTVSSCGDDAKPGEESKAKLEAQLAKLPKHIEDDFRAGDTNHDLRLQDTELEVMVKEDFDSFDVVKDGEINEADIRKDEEKGGLGEKPGEKAELDVDASLAFIDLNKDGRVPFDEYAEHVDSHFHQYTDTNKDGHIDPSESVAFYQRVYEGGKAK